MAATALEKARADNHELHQELKAAQLQIEQLRHDRNHWRDARLPDLEAECLASCVRAIEAMRNGPTNGESSRPMNRGLEYLPMQYGTSVEDPPSAKDNPIGRILLALAARYGQPIDCIEPAPKIVEGQRLLSVPAALAVQIERLINQGAF